MKDCSKHLKDAIALNTERLPLYAKLSNGETVVFSKKLIRYEQWALKGAWIFDRIGDRYQKHGIAYMKNEFVEMATVGNFSNQYPEGTEFYKPIVEQNFTSFIKQAKKLNNQKQFDQLVRHCKAALHQLENQAHVYCMVRHLIESMQRVAFLIPTYEQICDELNLKQPVAYSQFLIKVHIWSLPKSAQFDKAISPIQNKNIPFLYQDLPAIPSGEELFLNNR